jgi:hypothetical protein
VNECKPLGGGAYLDFYLFCLHCISGGDIILLFKVGRCRLTLSDPR